MFIGKNLNKLRVLNGYSRKELANLLDVTEQAIWQYEIKNTTPDLMKIYELAKIFKVKTQFFLREQHTLFDDNQNVRKDFIAFRSLNSNINSKILNSQHMYAMYLNNLTKYLYGFLKTPESLIFKLVNTVEEEFHMGPKDISQEKIINEIALLARKIIMNGSQNNKNLLLQLEKAGIIIFEKLIDDQADAYSFWTTDKEEAVIILGSDKGVSVRRNFDLAHELGHLLLHRNVEFELLSTEEYKAIEKEANNFASFFLLPEEDFIAEFEDIIKKSNPDSYLLMKEKWLVSYQALAMRAYKIGLISHQQYRYFWMSINKKGYKKEEPLDNQLTLERPMKIKSIFKLLLDKQVISLSTLLDEMSIEIPFLSQLTGIDEVFFNSYIEEQKNSLLFTKDYFRIK